MSIPTTITDEIEDGLQLTISHRNFNNSVVINYTNNGEKIRIPMDSLISKYNDLVSNYVVSTELTEADAREYRYAPKKFSQDMYGTTQYWSIILYLNDCHSVIEFTPEDYIKYIKPESINELINEILILENRV